MPTNQQVIYVAESLFSKVRFMLTKLKFGKLEEDKNFREALLNLTGNRSSQEIYAAVQKVIGTTEIDLSTKDICRCYKNLLLLLETAREQPSPIAPVLEGEKISTMLNLNVLFLQKMQGKEVTQDNRSAQQSFDILHKLSESEEDIVVSRRKETKLSAPKAPPSAPSEFRDSTAAMLPQFAAPAASQPSLDAKGKTKKDTKLLPYSKAQLHLQIESHAKLLSSIKLKKALPDEALLKEKIIRLLLIAKNIKTLTQHAELWKPLSTENYAELQKIIADLPSTSGEGLATKASSVLEAAVAIKQAYDTFAEGREKVIKLRADRTKNLERVDHCAAQILIWVDKIRARDIPGLPLPGAVVDVIRDLESSFKDKSPSKLHTLYIKSLLPKLAKWKELEENRSPELGTMLFETGSKTYYILFEDLIANLKQVATSHGTEMDDYTKFGVQPFDLVGDRAPDSVAPPRKSGFFAKAAAGLTDVAASAVSGIGNALG